MKIEKNIEVGNLIDCYGSLLTNKQLEILTQYCFDDLSLSEIAENYGITKQAVSDIINRTIKILNNYESKLGIINKKKQIEEIIKTTNNSFNANVMEKIKNILEE